MTNKDKRKPIIPVVTTDYYYAGKFMYKDTVVLTGFLKYFALFCHWLKEKVGRWKND